MTPPHTLALFQEALLHPKFSKSEMYRTKFLQNCQLNIFFNLSLAESAKNRELKEYKEAAEVVAWDSLSDFMVLLLLFDHSVKGSIV